MYENDNLNSFSEENDNITNKEQNQKVLTYEEAQFISDEDDIKDFFNKK